jgi:hypothetical protein
MTDVDERYQMTRQSRWRSADLARALKAAKEAGLAVGLIEIAPDGTLKIHAQEHAPAVETRGHDPFDAWKAKAEARKEGERAEAQAALKAARGRCGRENIIAAFAGEDTLTRHKVGKLLDITLEVLELATRYDLIKRSKVGGHARYTLNAVLKALGFRA